MNFYTWLFFLSFFGLLNGFLIALMLFNRPGKHVLLSRIIAMLFFMGAGVMLLITLVNTNIIYEYPIITLLEYFIALLVGPLLWYSVRLLLRSRKPTKKIVSIHFIPAFSYLLLGVIKPGLNVPVLWVMLHFQGYIAYSLIVFLGYKKNKEQKLPGKQKFWLMAILSFFTLIALSQWVRFIFSDTEMLNLIIPLTASLNFYLVLILGFNRSIIFPPSKQSLTKSTIGEKQKWAEIKRIILHKKLYTQKGLTLSQLATQLGVPTHYFSGLLHQEGQQHFPTFVNTLRVNYAKKLLADTKYAHYTIEAIAHDAGFKSRSAFYQCFKKQTGLTPSAYQSSCPESNNPDNQA